MKRATRSSSAGLVCHSSLLLPPTGGRTALPLKASMAVYSRCFEDSTPASAAGLSVASLSMRCLKWR